MKCITLRVLTTLSVVGAIPLLAAAQTAPQNRNQQAPGQSQQQPAQRSQQKVVAMVNGDAITRPELEANVKQAVRNRKVAPQQKQQIRRQTLDRLIESRLVEQYALENGPEVKQQEVEGVVKRFQQQLQNQPLTYDQFLKSRGYSKEMFHKRIAGSLAWRKFQQQQVTEEKLRGYFNENPDQFEQAEFQKARQKVIRAYVGGLWKKTVAEMKPQAEVKIVDPKLKKKQPQSLPPRQQ